jgi:DNA-binding FadR family transcriptional regulator
MKSEKRLYMKAVGSIQELIASGEYRPGSRLPPERELAEQFGMSRPTIREAIIALEAKGLVSVKTGSGVYILEQDERSTGFGYTVSAFELVEARVIIEGEAAALAAEMITSEELEQMREAVEQMATEPGSSSVADQRFHLILSGATKNRVFSSMIKQLWDAQENLEHIHQAHQSVCMNDHQRRIDEHQAIYDALVQRDANAARYAMRKHFSRMLTALHETSEERAVRAVRQQASEMRERFSFDRLVPEA